MASNALPTDIYWILDFHMFRLSSNPARIDEINLNRILGLQLVIVTVFHGCLFQQFLNVGFE